MNYLLQLLSILVFTLGFSATLFSQKINEDRDLEIIIKLKSNQNASQRSQFRMIQNADLIKSFKNKSFELWKFKESSSIEERLRELNKNPNVEYAEANIQYSIDQVIPSDPEFHLLWGLNNTGQTGGTVDADIDAPEGWDVNTSSENVVVAIIDSGIDWSHEDLVDNMWNNLGEDADGDGSVLEWNGTNWQFDSGDVNGIDDDGNGYIDDFVGWDFLNNDNNPYDSNSHGTHVAGTVGAKGNNSIGVSGVSWDVQLAALQFIGSNGFGSLSDAIDAIIYCIDNGISISNNSWGTTDYSQALYETLADADAAEHLFIAAAGNQGNNTDITNYYPSSYDHDNIISVASINHDDEISYFSNYGTVTVDLGAPGHDIRSCIPGDNYGFKKGTSMAAPHVAGAISLLWEMYPDKSYLEIKDATLNAVIVTPALLNNCVSNGRLNLNELLNYYGGGICSERDSLALVDFYQNAGGPNWINTWDLSLPLETWYGVGLNENGCVISLELPNNNLNGFISSEITKISNLQLLNCSTNNLQSDLPTDIGDLYKLEYLDLSNNQISGTFPSSMWNLINVLHIDLQSNLISGELSPNIGSLKKLTDLYLSNNNIGGIIPANVYQCTNLINIHLDNNAISGSLTGFIGLLNNLNQFVIFNNALTGCYNENLLSLCTSLDPNYNTNQYISDGNVFDAGWEEFCENDLGMCPEDLSCTGQDSLALLAFYNATNGPSWINQWDLTTPISTWQGVQLDDNGCVYDLFLGENGLTGYIPAEIGDLQKVYRVNLQYNSIGGSLPPEIGNMSSLEILNINSNNLVGEIPDEIQSATSLKQISFRFNNLSGEIPSSIGDLTQLESINFGINNLSGPIPTEIGELSNLTSLILNSNNLFGGIPNSLGNLHSLTWFDCGKNNLSGQIPLELSNLINLTDLYLQTNNLSGSLEFILGMNNLERLLLSANQITGDIPLDIGNLAKLERLDLHNNQISSEIPISIGSLSSLKRLSINNNLLIGNIPSSIGFLSNLNTLYLQNNLLMGAIPNTLSNLLLLSQVRLENNDLSGCYDSELSVLCSQLSATSRISENNNFDASWQDFCTTGSGTCAPAPTCSDQEYAALLQIYNSTNGPNWTNAWDVNEPIDTWYGVGLNADGCVSSLNLSNNNLSGNFPSDIQFLTSLDTLDLSRNNLVGPIPEEIGLLENLTRLKLNNNNLTGSIPYLIGNLQQLILLDISANSLTGSIPFQIGNLHSLVQLRLVNNNLTGEIPSSIGNLNQLEYLAISLNSLSGNIPVSFENLLKLEWCYINNNQLTGPMPENLGYMTSLTNFNASQNLLSGTLSIEVGFLQKLLSFDVSHNQITGEIPSSYGNMASLWILNLNDNQLTGSIPFSIGNLQELQVLQLYNNNLSGCYDSNLLTLCSSIVAPYNSNTFISDGNSLDADWEDFCASDSGVCLLPSGCSETDSISLVNLYNSANGLNWTTPWDLTEPMQNWYGVVLNDDGCVTELNLKNNNLTGYITAAISSIENLVRLDFNNNNLSGGIPINIGNLALLEFLDLQKNDLSGSIPASIGDLTNLEFLYLWSNDLSGEIPEEIGNLQQLQILNAAYNNFTGPIPTTVENMTELYFFSLRANSLSGPIPNEFGELTELLFLYLDYNNLVGQIPSFIADLNISTLRINNNNLSGCYDPYLAGYCGNYYATNANISDGNNFDAPWEDFCENGSGACANGSGITSIDGELSVTGFIQHATCAGGGEINIQISGGLHPLSINWNTGQSNSSIHDLSPGLYSVVVQDNSGLSVSMVFDIKGQFLPIYDDEGTEIDCAEFICPTALDFGSQLPAGQHKADRSIQTNGVLDNRKNAIVQAGLSIELHPGFEIKRGSVFEAIMEFCN